MRQRRTPVLVDVLLAALLTVLSVVTVTSGDAQSRSGIGVVLAVLAVAPLAVRQLAPVATMTVVALAVAGFAGLDQGQTPSSAIGLVIAMFTVATLRPRRVAAAMYALAVAVVLSYLRVDDVTWAAVAQAAVICLCAWALGDATRGWSREAQDAAAATERSMAAERNRIARELHDVVTHHMSVVALQTGLAEYVLETDRSAARTAVAHAGAASREALHDMGRMLGALRTDEAAPYQPQPDLRHLDLLVERLRGGGLDVTIQRSGTVRELSPGVELCAYRVVQESLTNVLKHAGPSSVATVTIDYGPRVLTVDVVDSGGTAQIAGGTGQGIRGMRERAELYGGVLAAGPVASGGFRVQLRLPAGADALAPEEDA
jgi:signal transduction histidine kinase